MALLPPDEALRIVLEASRPLETESVSFRSASGRVLAAPVVSPIDLPPFDRSAMDGFAVRAADASSGGAVLDVIGEIPAGRPARPPVGPGQAVRIMTGAPVPPGADAVEMVEKTQPVDSGRRVRLLRPVSAGQHIRRRGEELTKGAEALPAGSPVRPAEVALLSTLGVVDVPVHRAPRVTLVTTGDEIVEPEREPLPHQIRNSNSYAIEAILRNLSVPADYLGIVSDTREAVEGAVRTGLGADLLCLSGGVSMGVYDIVSDVLRSQGVEILFHKVRIKPGKPLLFGRKGRTLVFGLPGNPVSAFCTFVLFVLPAVRRMLGHGEPAHEETRGILEEEIRQRPGRDWYCLARARWEEGSYRVRPVASRGSADVASACRANAFVVVPSEREHLPAGSEIRLLLWGGGF